MRKRSFLLLLHWIDSLFTIVIAAVVYMVLVQFFHGSFLRAAKLLSDFGVFGIAITVVVGLGLFSFLFPRHLRSACASLRRFPLHCGVIFKAFLGIALLWAVQKGFNISWPNMPVFPLDIVDIFTTLVTIIVGLLTVWFATGLRLHFSIPGKKKQELLHGQQGDLEKWFSDDQPIDNYSENLISEHATIAERILSRLITVTALETQSKTLPNLALIGPYGCGKTSICNLVEDAYKRKAKEDNTIPQVLFCRFEAWQFLKPEAAVANLLRTATNRIREVVDAFELISVPQDYVRAIEGGGGFWGSVIVFLLRKESDPKTIAEKMGDLLVRLNLRLMIFIDDLDRIEGNSRLVQQTITMALNQLQNVPHLQYIISVGQIPTTLASTEKDKPTLDLLKLTRFQELVPRMSAETVLGKFRELRDRVVEDDSIYHLWAQSSADRGDPLEFSPFHEHVPSLSWSADMISELAATPRVLKCVLRKSRIVWEQGLKGEIDWYDLILANTLRAAELDIFEWILREPTAFLSEPRSFDTRKEDQEKQEEKERVHKRLLACIQNKDDRRIKLVTEALEELFPAFKSRSNPSSFVLGSVDGTQKLPCQSYTRVSYLERFLAGTLPEKEIPDQPTLKYIDKLGQVDFEKGEFEELYLSSYEKLTGDINKLVQFSQLLSIEKALVICDTILAWLAVPEHATVWPKPHEFIRDMMGDIIRILKNAGGRETALGSPKENWKDKEKWIQDKIKEYGSDSPFVANTLLRYTKQELLDSETYSNLIQELAELLRNELIEGSTSFSSRLTPYHYSLAWLLGIIGEHKNYESFKTELTQKLVDEAENDSTNQLKGMIAITFVSIRTPVMGGEIPIERYEFDVNKDNNKKKYDMSIILPALKKWKEIEFADKVVAKAFDHVAAAYQLDLKEGAMENGFLPAQE